jgi:hypothetical protein
MRRGGRPQVAAPQLPWQDHPPRRPSKSFAFYSTFILYLDYKAWDVVTGVILVVGIYVFAAVALLMAGAAIGVVAVVSLASRREDHDFSLTSDITNRRARAARRINGVGIRGLNWLTSPATTGAAPDRRRS